MKVTVEGTGQTVDLGQRDFVGQGGEGMVYRKGTTGYKIYHDPANMLPRGKFQELSAITDSHVVKPQRILLDAKGRPVGYTTTFVQNAQPVCRLFPKAYRQREKITPEQIQELVRKLQDIITNVHSAHILIVDANEMNFLVTGKCDDIWAIDVDSYQTPHYPAPAIMESIRDWTIQNHKWTELSDWYSFSILSFQMFIGIHPFKGQYHGPTDALKTRLPTDPEDDAFAVTRRRMQSNVSVFHPEVKVPTGALMPFTVIPKAYKAWYDAIFSGKRCAPPTDFGAAIFILPTIQAVSGSTHLEITEIGQYEGIVLRVWAVGSHLAVQTDQGVWLDKVKTPISPVGVVACGYDTKSDRVAIVNDHPIPGFYNLTDRTGIQWGLQADAVESYNGQLYVKAGDTVHEAVLTGMAPQVIATTRSIVQCLPHATKLFSGVVIQNMLGSTFVSLLTAPGQAHQVRVKELDEYRVLDAKYDHGVLMVVGSKKGQFDRLVFRFDADDTYDVRVVSGISSPELNFVTLDSGVCVCLNEDVKLEVFSNRKGSAAVKVMDDKALSGDMLLFKQGGTVLVARGSRIYRMRMR